MSLTVGGDRRSGKTTALVDLSIMNALAGQEIAYFCDTSSSADFAARACRDRLHVIGLRSPKEFEYVEPRLVTLSSGGCIEFMKQDALRAHTLPRNTFRVFDGDDWSGGFDVPEHMRRIQ